MLCCFGILIMFRVVDVGTPPTHCSDSGVHRETEVQFHNFANLSTERDAYEASPVFSSLGHVWTLDIYPGGEENSPEGYVAIDLVNMENKSIKVEFGYSVRDADGKEVVYWKPKTNEFEHHRGSSCGYPNFTKRSKIMKSLVDGSLVIEVRMRLAGSSKSTPSFVPKNSLINNIRNVLILYLRSVTRTIHQQLSMHIVLFYKMFQQHWLNCVSHLMGGN